MKFSNSSLPSLTLILCLIATEIEGTVHLKNDSIFFMKESHVPNVGVAIPTNLIDTILGLAGIVIDPLFADISLPTCW